MIPRARIAEWTPEDVLNKLDGARLEELRRYFEEAGDKVSLRRLEALSKTIVDLAGSFSKQYATSRDARLLFSYSFRLKFSYFSRGERRTVEHEALIEHDVWVRLRSGLFIVFDAPLKRISRVISELASLRLFGDPTVIAPLKLDRSAIEAIEDWVTSKEYPVSGNIMRASFRRTRLDNSILDEVSIKKEGLDTTKIYEDIKGSSHELSSITFVTPLLPEINRRLTCRLDSRGGLLIYTPNVRREDIDVLILYLEKVLKLE
mgnify:CR=1 FL=1